MTMLRWIVIAGSLLLGPITTAMAQFSPQVSHWAVQNAGPGAVSIQLGGVWNDSCIPLPPTVSRDGFAIRLHMWAGPLPGGLCFAAFRPWQHQVTVNGLVPGQYQVEAVYEIRATPGPITPFGQHGFNYVPPPQGTASQPVPFTPMAWLVMVLALLWPARRRLLSI